MSEEELIDARAVDDAVGDAVGEAMAQPLPEETQWMCGMLDLPADEWATVVSDSRTLAPYELPAAMAAIEHAPGLVELGCFEQGFRAALRLVEVPTAEGVRRSRPVIGTLAAFREPGDEPAIARLEQDPGQPELLRVVTIARTAERCDEAHRTIRSHIRDEHSTWRRRPVLLDPSPISVVRPLTDGPDLPPAPVAARELTRTIIEPIRRAEGGAVAGRGLLIAGPSGSGKSTCVSWLGRQLAGTATTLVLPPRGLGNPEVVRLAFEMVADDAPAVIVLEHLDLLVGDRHSMRYPESLAEIVGQLDSVAGSGVFAIVTTSSTEAPDAALATRLPRTLTLGAAPAVHRERMLAGLVERYGGATVEALTRRTTGWTIGQLAELQRLARLAEETEGATDVDLTGLASHALRPVAAAGEAAENGTYL